MEADAWVLSFRLKPEHRTLNIEHPTSNEGGIGNIGVSWEAVLASADVWVLILMRERLAVWRVRLRGMQQGRSATLAIRLTKIVVILTHMVDQLEQMFRVDWLAFFAPENLTLSFAVQIIST
jgi:hypothetical protein